MNDVTGWVSAAAGLLALLSLAAAAVAVLRANYAKATNDALKENNAALTERVGILEDEERRNKAALKRLGAENDLLKEMVHGHVELAAFGERLSVLERLVKSVMDEIRDSLNRLLGRES